MKERYVLLDSIRGITLLSMILYHGMFDLVEIYGLHIPWFVERPGYVWQQSICWIFILLSGFCWNLGKRHLKRGLVISAWGLLITGVTYAFMPSEKILFGILTFTGTAMLLLIPLSKVLERIPSWMGFAGSFLLFGLTRNVNRGIWGFELFYFGRVPKVLYRGLFMTFLGLPDPGFFSGDYFSLFPWVFLYLTGYFLYGMLMKFPEVKKALTIHLPAPFLETAGRHSLLLYLLHQPLLMLVFTAADVLEIL